ncbi:glycosyltransferase [Leeuwenhoekiella sp. W20_SRS_FM14]|uniref:glycosyltransferase n=1 Tax=Leeuwenhoekiella sp. W20_SRS_FM14 TaxID=3240270 RepID=UPI003F9CB596
MKLAIVTAFPPSKVTLNEYAYYLVKAFRANQEVSELVLLTDVSSEIANTHLDVEGCQVTVKSCWSFNSYSNIVTVVRALKETKPDAVLFNLQFMKFGDKKIPAALGLALPGICKLMGLPTVVLLHNIMEQVDLNEAGFTANKFLQRAYNFIGTQLTKMILKADFVALTISKYVSILQEKYTASNVGLIPHGTLELPAEPSYELPAGPLRVMTFGKFGTYKKVEMLIEAVEHLRKVVDLDIEIVVAGTDNPNVKGYLDGVQKRYAHVKQLVFTGYVAEEDVPKLFEESSVVVFPYTSTTGSSGVLHQAGSYGKAVVMPDLGDLGILSREEGYEARFFEPNNVKDLAKALSEVLVDQNYRTRMGQANYKAATALPMDAIAQKYIEVFKQIISRKEQKASNDLIIVR